MALPKLRPRPKIAPSLELRDVSLEFGPEIVFKDINLSIFKGDRVILVGPSGKGKTCLLKMLAGLLPPTRGELWIEGQNFHKATAREQQNLRMKMGMLFQKNALFDSLTNSENIAFALREATQTPEDEIAETVEYFLEAVGIAHAAKLYPSEISGGMQKRLGIARALALNPEIVFYDDPTAGLDPITSRRIIELIVELQIAKGGTLVAVTNDMNRAFQLQGAIILVCDQTIVSIGTEKDAKASQDPRVIQFVRGLSQGPLTHTPNGALA